VGSYWKYFVKHNGDNKNPTPPPSPKGKLVLLSAHYFISLVTKMFLAFLFFCHFWPTLMVGVELWVNDILEPKVLRKIKQ
jgi:hypothetical protein